jgi:hypothetical protein
MSLRQEYGSQPDQETISLLTVLHDYLGTDFLHDGFVVFPAYTTITRH